MAVNQVESIPAASWPPRKVVLATLIVLGIALAFFIVYRFRLVAFSLFEAIVFSTAITPLVNWLQKRGVSRAFAITLVFVLALVILAGVILLTAPLIGDQGATILTTLDGYYRTFHEMLTSSPSILVRRLAFRLPTALVAEAAAPPATPGADSQPLDQVAVALSYGTQFIGGFFAFAVVLLLTYYWTLDRNLITMWSLNRLPSPRKEAVRDFFASTDERVGAYLRGLLILCSAIGLAAFVGYLIVGLPNALLLGLLAGIFEVVPLVGPILGAIPAIIVAITVDPSKVIWVILVTFIIQTLENHILVPRVMAKAVGVNPVVSLLSFAAFSSLFGFAGALLAVPLAVVIQLMLDRLVFEPTISPAVSAPAGRDTVSVLRYEAQELISDVRKQVREKEGITDDQSDQVEDAIEAIVNDLDSILAQAESNQAEEADQDVPPSAGAAKAGSNMAPSSQPLPGQPKGQIR